MKRIFKLFILCSLTFILSLIFRGHFGKDSNIYFINKKELVSLKNSSTAASKHSSVLFNDKSKNIPGEIEEAIISNSIKESLSSTAEDNFIAFQGINSVEGKVNNLMNEGRLIKFLFENINLPRGEIEKFLKIRIEYQELKNNLTKEFDNFLLEKYGDINLIDRHREWNDFQLFIHSKYERKLISIIGHQNFAAYSRFKKRNLNVSELRELPLYPSLPAL
jgi:hypothetical protein